MNERLSKKEKIEILWLAEQARRYRHDKKVLAVLLSILSEKVAFGSSWVERALKQ